MVIPGYIINLINGNLYYSFILYILYSFNHLPLCAPESVVTLCHSFHPYSFSIVTFSILYQQYNVLIAIIQMLL